MGEPRRVPDETWFDIRPIGDDTWMLSEPLHAENGHCYLLGCGERALLIDTGLGVLPLRPVVRSLVGDVPVSVVLTHTHWDHLGALDEFGSFAAHGAEVPLREEAVTFGCDPLDLLCERESPLPESADLEGYRKRHGMGRLSGLVCERTLSDGDVIRCGSRTLEVIHTPGHSPGGICLLERARGSLFCGDLLYRGPIYLHLPGADPAAFRDSVRLLSALDGYENVWPGHNAAPLGRAFVADVAEAADGIRPGEGVVEGDGFSLLLG